LFVNDVVPGAPAWTGAADPVRRGRPARPAWTVGPGKSSRPDLAEP